MNINNISGFLKKFKNLKPSDTFIKEAFISSVKEIMNVEITKHEINIQRNTIFLNVHPALKTEIYMKKNELIEALFKKTEKKTITNIV